MATTGADAPAAVPPGRLAGPLPDRLVTARLVLRPPVAADAAAIQRLADDWEVARYTARIPHPYPDGAAAAFLAEAAEDRAAGRLALWAITLRDAPARDAPARDAPARDAPARDAPARDGQTGHAAPIGMIGLEAAAEPGEAEVGYWLGREHWGRGYAAEALRRVLGQALAPGGPALVFAEAHPDNRASIRVLEKAGMRAAGRVQGRLRGVPAETVRYEARPAPPVPTVLVAAVALIDADGRVLLAERPAGKAMAGLWEFPGGKVEPGETPEAALVRELAEELGVDTEARCLAPIAFASHRYETFHLLMPLYACRNWRGPPVAHEGQRLAWARPARLADYPMPPADAPLVAALRDLL